MTEKDRLRKIVDKYDQKIEEIRKQNQMLATYDFLTKVEYLNTSLNSCQHLISFSREVINVYKLFIEHYDNRRIFYSQNPSEYNEKEDETLLDIDQKISTLVFSLKEKLSSSESHVSQEICEICSTYESIARMDSDELPEWLSDLAEQARKDYHAGLCEEWNP